MCKFLVETSIVSVCKKLFHLTYCKTFYKLTFIAHCVEKQNRHYFCDRAAWGWMTAKQNQDSFKTCLETTKFNSNSVIFVATRALLHTPSQPCLCTRCCEFAVCSPYLSKIESFSGLVYGSLPFCKDLNPVDVKKMEKIRSTPKPSTQVNEFSSVPRSCTFLPRDLWPRQIRTVYGGVGNNKL